jgi:glycerophosphoryl diester phosphodiesterase
MAIESRGRGWAFVLSLTSLNLGIFISTALLIGPSWETINSFLRSATGLSVNYVLGIVLLSLGAFIFSLTALIIGLRKLLHQSSFSPRKRLVGPAVGFALLFDFLLVVLVLLWGPDGIIMFNALEFLLPFIFVILDGLVIIGIYSFFPTLVDAFRALRRASGGPDSKGTLSLFLTVLVAVCVFGMPLILVPSNAYEGVLPAKPEVIAHRCGGYLGPENTLEAASTAIGYGIAGIECDVQVSSDGIPFLLHDDTLQRTTNVNEVFPLRASDNADSFTIAELETLDTGSWFVTSDPFNTIRDGFVSATQVASYQNATIPTLQEAAAFAADHSLILNVDFKQPAASHPYYSDYLNICLSTIGSVGMDSHVWITSRNASWLEFTIQNYPAMITALTLDNPLPQNTASFEDKEFDMINTNMEIPNGVYHQLETEGVPVNAWTVDFAFRFSQLWCLGVDSVTSDIPHIIEGMSAPTWSLPAVLYQALWIGYALVLVVVTVLKWNRSPTPYNASHSHLVEPDT